MTAVKHVLPDDPVDRLETVGHLLYGREWPTRLGNAIGFSRISIHRWRKRQYSTPPNLDALLADAAEREVARLGEVKAALKELRQRAAKERL